MDLPPPAMDNGVRSGEVAICLPLAIMIDLVLDVINPRKAWAARALFTALVSGGTVCLTTFPLFHASPRTLMRRRGGPPGLAGHHQRPRLRGRHPVGLTAGSLLRQASRSTETDRARPPSHFIRFFLLMLGRDALLQFVDLHNPRPLRRDCLHDGRRLTRCDLARGRALPAVRALAARCRTRSNDGLDSAVTARLGLHRRFRSE